MLLCLRYISTLTLAQVEREHTQREKVQSRIQCSFSCKNNINRIKIPNQKIKKSEY